MKSFIAYSTEMLVCSGLFLLFYRLLFAKRVHETLCRYYLVGAMVLATLIPCLQLPLYPAETIHELPAIVEVESVKWIEATPPQEALRQSTTSFAWSWFSGYLYGAVSLVALGLMLWRIHTIFRLRRKAVLTHTAAYTLAESEAVKAPFSFWRTIYIGNYYTPLERMLIISHERAHIRRRHTLDRLLLEGLHILFWFNPFFWLAERWLIEVQEWQADRDTLNEGYDVRTYQITIFKQLFGYNPDITCGLSNSFTKNRFIMMTQQRHGRHPLLRIVAAIPLVAGMILAFGATTAKPTLDEQPTSPLHMTPETKLVMNGKEYTPQQLRELNTAKLHLQPGKILFNGREVSPEELVKAIANYRAGLDDPSKATIRISADDNTPVGLLQDCKVLIREAGVLRLQYEGGMGIGAQLLPPPQSTESGKVSLQEPTQQHVAARNLYLIRMNRNGMLLCGSRGSEQQIPHFEAVANAVKQFIANPENRADLSEQQAQTFTLADGRTFTLPVSKGMISIEISRESSATHYFTLMRSISRAYAELRNEAAHQLFDRPMQSLPQEEQQLLHRAIPIRFGEQMVQVR